MAKESKEELKVMAFRGDPEFIRLVKEFQKRTGVNFSEMARMAIRDFIATYEERISTKKK